MFGLGLGSKIAVGLGVVMLLMAGGFYMYFKWAQTEIKTLNESNATLKANVATLTGTITEQNESIKRLDDTRVQDQKTILDLSQKFNDARTEVASLRQTFAKHDLNKLSMAKPGLIEHVINNGTANVGKKFVDITTPNKEAVVELPAQPAVEATK